LLLVVGDRPPRFPGLLLGARRRPPSSHLSQLLGGGPRSGGLRRPLQQYRCVEEACPRKAFTECIPELPAGARVTGRPRRAAARSSRAWRRSLPRSEPTS
jgi:hypothetical protein